MRILSVSVLALMVQTAAPAAFAEDTALVIGTQRYDTLDNLRGGVRVIGTAEALGDVGFDVLTAENATRADLDGLLERVAAQVAPSDRLVVVLSGRFATDGVRTWYLPRDAAPPTMATIDRVGFPVETLMRLAATSPGEAVIVLGTEDGNERYDRWLRVGIGALDVPQGVTVVRGGPAAIAVFVEEDLAAPDGDLAALIAANDDITVAGFLPDPFRFAGPAVAAPVVEPQPPVSQTDAAAERALWDGAVALDTAAAFANYLDRYPTGQFAAEAATRRDAILAEPNRAARLAEEALRLSRDDSRDIQRALSLLNFNPRGIDGIFGPGTRGAITNWQQQNGFAQTGFVTAEQVARLEAQAARRAAEIEAEAERQRQAQVVADRAFWDETGAAGDEVGLHAYLDRYPDGLFSQAAQTRLAAIEDQQRQVAEAQDAAAWDRARAADSVAGYRDYLGAFPQGSFASAAEARIAELGQVAERAPQVEAWEAAERALGINGLTAQLVETRLEASGLEPGPVDGTFDDDTRRAIRAYQRDRGLEQTGYLNEQTVVLLLAEVLQ